MIYILSCIAGGFLAGWVARSQLEKRLRGGNLGRDPLVMNEGRVQRGNGNGSGTVCQVCWEAQSSCLWWAMVQLLPEEGTHA
jgi:hypothetical protein